MKVLAYNSTYVNIGHEAGSEVSLHEALKLLVKAGHTVDVLLSRAPAVNLEPFEVDGIRVHPFTDKADPHTWFPEYDLIVSQLEAVGRASLMCALHKKPLLQYVHNYTDFSVGLARKYGDAVVFNSKTSQAAANLQHDRPQMVLYPIVSPSKYRVKPPGPTGNVTLVNLSDGTGPWYDKGHRMLYWLAQRCPDIQFTGVIGAYGPQDARYDFPNVRIMPHQSDPKKIYEQASVIIQASTVESFGRVAVEAASSGIPSISSDLDGPVEAGVSVAYANPEDVWTWECALKDILERWSFKKLKTKEKSDQLWNRTQAQFNAFVELAEATATKEK